MLGHKNSTQFRYEDYAEKNLLKFIKARFENDTLKPRYED